MVCYNISECLNLCAPITMVCYMVGDCQEYGTYIQMQMSGCLHYNVFIRWTIVKLMKTVCTFNHKKVFVGMHFWQIFVYLFEFLIQLCLYVCDVCVHNCVNLITIIDTQTNYICLGCAPNFVNIRVLLTTVLQG